QLALTLGLVNSPLADQTLEPVLQDAAADPARLEAILAGFAGREAEFLAVRLHLPAWAKAEPWRQKLLTAGASLMWRQRRPLAVSAKHQALYDLGRKEYMALCAACHHPAGYGDAGKGPALVDSDWLDYSEERLVRLVLYGLRGPITVSGEPFNRDGALEMPGMYQALDDEKIAGILTFIRREWRE